jgi:hypothetical protein
MAEDFSNATDGDSGSWRCQSGCTSCDGARAGGYLGHTLPIRSLERRRLTCLTTPVYQGIFSLSFQKNRSAELLLNQRLL